MGLLSHTVYFGDKHGQIKGQKFYNSFIYLGSVEVDWLQFNLSFKAIKANRRPKWQMVVKFAIPLKWLNESQFALPTLLLMTG